jgi:acyl carrier protein
MSFITPEDVRLFLTDHLRRNLQADGRGLAEDLSDDCDLLLSGILNSLGLLELVTALSSHFNREINFEALDPEQMTIVGPLCKFVAEQLSQN